MHGLCLIAAVLLSVWAAGAFCEEAKNVAPPPLPEGDNGIAAKHLGDVGIEKDPAVIFHDGFEDCSSPADLRKKWDSHVFHVSTLRIAEEPENVFSGRKAVEMTFPLRPDGSPVGNGVGKHLKEERDILFLRFYKKYENGFDVTGIGSFHNGGGCSAHYEVDGRSTPGVRADGRNKFLVGYECARSSAKQPGPLMVYVYHPEQLQAFGDIFFPSGEMQPGGRSAEVGRKYFGPHFIPRPEVIPELDRWYCYELMVRANTVGQRDGRIACWVDGELVADFPNLRMRDIESLKMDNLGIGGYIRPNTLRANKIWYDDVVAATSYIGPIAKEKKADPLPGTKEGPKPAAQGKE